VGVLNEKEVYNRSVGLNHKEVELSHSGRRNMQITESKETNLQHQDGGEERYQTVRKSWEREAGQIRD